jgi:hypothetical protein
MNKGAKVFLIGCGSVVLLGLLVVAGLVVWLRSGAGEELLAQGQAAREQGREAGTKLAGTACLDAALLRMEAAGSFGEAIESRLWMEGCLEGSAPGEALCATVPPESEIMASVNWRLAQCQQRNRTDSACSSLMAGAQSYCGRWRAESAGSPAG